MREQPVCMCVHVVYIFTMIIILKSHLDDHSVTEYYYAISGLTPVGMSTTALVSIVEY